MTSVDELVSRRRELLSEWDALSDAMLEGRIRAAEYRRHERRIKAALEDINRQLAEMGSES